jgi:hypothetical protein
MNPRVRIVSGYLVATISVCLAVVGTFAIRPWIAPSGSLLFFPAIVAVAMYYGYGAALVATVLSTLALGYFFVAPAYSFSIGADDFVRLTAFAAVAIATSWVASARRSAEASLRQSVEDLQTANATLQRVTEWPALFGNDAVELTRDMLQYAARVVGAADVFAIFEANDEPWVFLAAASREEVLTRYRPADRAALLAEVFSARWPEARTPSRVAMPNPALDLDFAGKNVGAVPFRTAHLTGRVFFAGMMDLTERNVPGVELVAREVGRSLDQLHLANQIRVIAARQERARLARELPSLREQLYSLERAIANEQTELRSFIDGTRRTPGRNPGEIPA